MQHTDTNQNTTQATNIKPKHQHNKPKSKQLQPKHHSSAAKWNMETRDWAPRSLKDLGFPFGVPKHGSKQGNQNFKKVDLLWASEFK